MTENTSAARSPIVVVLGHIDHGKTTLLDTLRKTKVAGRESGGITQHVAAYELAHQGRRITFIDTPGHEAFEAMRKRGANLADVAVLIVAADDGVKPQTIESLRAIQDAHIPFVVAINKIDLPSADAARVKAQLAEKGIAIEEWGGKVPVVEISAKAGTNLDALLEMILLVSELEELTIDPSAPARGVVLESYRDPRRGITAELVLRDGSLKKGYSMVAGSALASVKIMEDSEGNALNEAMASSPVRIVGFDILPEVGAPFAAYADKSEAEKIQRGIAGSGEAAERLTGGSPRGEAGIPLFFKADTTGSLEALAEALKKIQSEAKWYVAGSGIGDMGENDMRFVEALSQPLVFGFRVNMRAHPRFDVIYEAIEWLTEALAVRVRGLQSAAGARGTLLVLRYFRPAAAGGSNHIIGGRVLDGSVRRGDVFNDGKGQVIFIERDKARVEEIKKGEEAGLEVKISSAPREGQRIAFYEKTSS